jgi:hypothetical protein
MGSCQSVRVLEEGVPGVRVRGVPVRRGARPARERSKSVLILLQPLR